MEYLVRSIPDSPPEISVNMPGRDLKVMALEEVSIAVTAKDDFGMTKLALNYNVAGGFEQKVDFLNAAGQDCCRPSMDRDDDLFRRSEGGTGRFYRLFFDGGG